MTFYLHSLSVTSLTALLSYWLPSLLVMSSCAWILSGVVVENTKEEWPQLFKPLTSPVVIMMPEVHRRGKRTVYIASMMILILLAATGLLGLGYGIRDHQLSSSIVPYTDVLILPPSEADVDFDIQPARMKPIPSKLCDSKVDWKYGETLADLLFEQRRGCKRVISYHRPKGEMNAAIQMR